MNKMMSDISLRYGDFSSRAAFGVRGVPSQAGACVDECHDTSCSTRKIAVPQEIAHIINVQSNKL